MKRVGYLYEKVVDVENCKRAILNASKGKRNREYVKLILDNIDYYASELSRRIQTDDFLTPYKPKVIRDISSNKEREILIPRFYPDQCVHHAVIQIIQPYILKSSHFWSCANVKGRGISRAVRGTKRLTRKKSRNKYCLKLDIHKFYPSVSHDVLRKLLRRKFKDEKLLRVLDLIIESCKIGVPIGNYTSPCFAELYLQSIDHFILEKAKIKGYVRYADDMVIVDTSKKRLHHLLKEIKRLAEEIDLEIKDNWQIFKIYNNGKYRKIDFVGRCFGKGVITVRKKTALRFMRQSRRILKSQKIGNRITYHSACGYISRSSCLKGTNSYGLRKKYYEPINIKSLKENVSNESKRQSSRQSAEQSNHHGRPSVCSF